MNTSSLVTIDETFIALTKTEVYVNKLLPKGKEL